MNDSMTNKILDKWESNRMWIRDVTLDEADVLQELCEKSDYLRKWEGNEEIDPEHIKKTILEGDLPPNGVRGNFKIQSFHLKSTNELVGYITYYFGYPTEEIVWINFLFIDPIYQGKGYSKEIINRLEELLRETTFSKIRLLVKLKNWPAIRFWTSLQFTKIIGYYGDKILSDETFAGLVIEKEL
ncbi:GNAT family N-acetyltransferase [Bacillus sp. CGMCC 1.16607]|uniref:GNAT family N-acetyltransferase n=1 Tax=Bacillus sp. CGMCC 1.16607 TaxID=3351842 RepID=UPI00362ABD30